MGHIMSEGPHFNSIVCHPEDQETMITDESCIGWINYLCKLKEKKVMDFYSEAGRCECMQCNLNTALHHNHYFR